MVRRSSHISLGVGLPNLLLVGNPIFRRAAAHLHGLAVVAAGTGSLLSPCAAILRVWATDKNMVHPVHPMHPTFTKMRDVSFPVIVRWA